ncbi:MAG: heme biosynthesis protein HemY [Colwellia sp.]
MIRFIIIVLLFFAVVAFSPLLLDDPGYILISVGNYVFELTVYAAFFWLTAIVVILFFTYKIIRGGFKFSFGAWHKVVFASQRRGIVNFNKGLSAYMLEDYAQAEKLFDKCAEPSKRKHSAYLLAASAASKQQLDANTNHYLALLENESSKIKEMGLESVIVKVKLLMNQAQKEADKSARVLIDEYHKQIGHDARLLSLEIDLCIIEQRFEQAVDYLTNARKEKTIDDKTLQAWESKAYFGVFTDKICQQDQNTLQEYWQKLSRKTKHREAVLFAYCKVLAAQNITEPLTKLLQPLLKKQPDTSFLKQLRTLPIKQSEVLIALVQKHLHKDKHNAQWLSCLGHLAIVSEQWSMAEKAFGSLVNLDANNQKEQYDKQDLQALAKALTEQEQHQAANEVWLKISEM